MKNNITELLKKDNSTKKILQYVREDKASGRMYRKYGNTIARKYLGVEFYDRISEIDKKVTHHIDLRKYSYFDYTTEDFTIFNQIINLPDVVRNDRVFRFELSYDESIKLAFSCTKYCIELFKNNTYDVLLTHIVDEFVIDILTSVASYFGVTVICYSGNSYDNSYMAILINGEYIKVREPKEQEVDRFLKLLKDRTSKPYVRSKNTVYKSIARYYFIYKIKYIFHYLIRYKLLDDISYRNMMTRAQTYPRRLKDIFIAPSYFYKSINDLPTKLNKSNTVYIPLHYHPEATTDYWIKDPKYLTYYPSLVKTIKSYSERGFTIIIKEHTASYLQRDVSLYAAISKISGVYLLSPFITTYEVLDYIDYVVVWTGTTGVEAIMQNKKVILAAGETYYSLNQLAYVGHEDKAKIPTEHDKRILARHILSSLLPV